MVTRKCPLCGVHVYGDEGHACTKSSTLPKKARLTSSQYTMRTQAEVKAKLKQLRKEVEEEDKKARDEGQWGVQDSYIEALEWVLGLRKEL